MPNPFDAAVDTALDTAARVVSVIDDVVHGRGVDMNTLLPKLVGVVATATGMHSRDSKVEQLTIGSLDNLRLTVAAQYNPKEIQIDKDIPWHPHNSTPATKRPRTGAKDDAEINAAPTRSMSLELLFDGYESNRSVQPELDKLEEMSSIREPGSKQESLRRPHHCVVTWGATGTRPFRCVIQSLSTKLTMFAPSGTPLRATCTIKLQEVDVLSKLREDGHVVREVIHSLQSLQSMLTWKP